MCRQDTADITVGSVDGLNRSGWNGPLTWFSLCIVVFRSESVGQGTKAEHAPPIRSGRPRMRHPWLCTYMPTLRVRTGLTKHGEQDSHLCDLVESVITIPTKFQLTAPIVSPHVTNPAQGAYLERKLCPRMTRTGFPDLQDTYGIIRSVSCPEDWCCTCNASLCL